MTKLLLALSLLFLVSCHGCGGVPPARDMRTPADIAQAADFASTGVPDLACLPQFRQCLAPAVCCAGLICVGGACAKMP